jgi:hypothetical protein
MAAPIIQHGDWEDNYDDPDHPIPSLTALDVHGIRKGGGSDLVVIVASPLGFDERSQKRLLDKLNIYLRYINSPEYEAQFGPPTPDTTAIEVQLHPDSDPRIVDLLSRCEPWALENRTTLRTTMHGGDRPYAS